MNKLCNKASITMQEYNRSMEYNDVEALYLSIKYPKISMRNNPFAEHLINTQIILNVNNYIRHANCLYSQAVGNYHNAKDNNFPFNSFEAYMEYKITYNENCFLSMYVDEYDFTGGAHGITKRTSNTWELCKGTQLSLCNFFKPGTDYETLIIDEITKLAKENNEQSNLYFEDYESLIAQNFNPNSFYLSPDGITIYYQQYDIAPYSTGIVEFTIPYSVVGWEPNC